MREMARAGVPLMLSSDAGVRITPFDDIASSMRFYSMMMEASPLRTIQAITQAPAQALGLGQETGAIEVGKRADLLILDADPLADLENMRQVSSVIVDGHLAVTGGALREHRPPPC